MNNRHPAVTLRHPDVGDVEIDEEIAGLIRACWQAGIETSESCQEAAPGVARVGFLYLDDMGAFYAAVRGEDDEIFYGWNWQLHADGGLHGSVTFPRSHIDWAAARVAELPAGD